MDIRELYLEFLAGSGICTDSRLIKPGQLFFGLAGSRANGSDFALQALRDGARYAIVDDPALSGHPGCILVPSALETLQQLAGWHRQQLNIPVIGITGSVGKTTTKSLIHAVLSSRYKAFCTLGNLNNHIGVPLSVLSIGSEHEIAVIEMGANHIGEIESLCEIARPTHGLITRIGKAHLEGFGSLEGVLIAKTELFRYLQKNKGLAFVNDQDELVFAASKGFEMPKVMIHEITHSSILAADPFLTIRLELAGEPALEVVTRIPGSYNLENIEAAACVGKYFGVPLPGIKAALEKFESGSNRSQVIEHGGNSFLMDAYNANPVSMAESIRSFAAIPTQKKKVLILGEMRELGTDSPAEHQGILDLIAHFTWAGVILVGPEYKELVTREPYYHFPDVASLKPWFQAQEFRDSFFLVKGSRGVALEQLFEPGTVNPGSAH